MIYTGNYHNCKTNNVVSISGDRGKQVHYEGECYPSLAPKLAFWKTWHDNIGKISEEENNEYYILQYYRQVLKDLDPAPIATDLDGKILLCYEESFEFCHRHIVASWLEDMLGIIVPEVQVSDDGEYTELERPSEISKVYKMVTQANRKGD